MVGLQLVLKKLKLAKRMIIIILLDSGQVKNGYELKLRPTELLRWFERNYNIKALLRKIPICRIMMFLGPLSKTSADKVSARGRHR